MKRPIRWKQLLHKLLFPHPAVVLVCVPAAAALLVWGVAGAGQDSPAASSGVRQMTAMVSNFFSRTCRRVSCSW